jgi:hypothetical protein
MKGPVRLFLGFGIGLGVATLLTLLFRGYPTRDAGPAIGDQQPRGIGQTLRESRPGSSVHELVLVYIGSSTCSQSTRPDVAETVVRLRQRLGRALAEKNPNGVLTFVGVDLDPIAGSEMGHLVEFGQLDQVSLGGSFMNWVAFEQSLPPFNGAPGAPTPQVVVLSRVVERLNAVGSGMRVRSSPPRIIGRAYGIDRISRLDPEMILESMIHANDG